MVYSIPSAPTKYVAINVPFSFSGGTVGYVSVNDKSYWRNKVAAITATEKGERVWRPTYGASLTSLANFESADSVMSSLTEAVSESLRRWLPDVDFKDIIGTYNYQTGIITLTVNYTAPNGEDQSVKIKTGSFSTSGEAY